MESLLKCPITHELLVDPITTPCGHTFSRESLISWFQTGNRGCPLCQAIMPQFDPLTAPKNITIASLLENNNTNIAQEHAWKAKLNVIKANGLTLPVAKLTVELNNSQFKVKPVLFIAATDFSGSMSGGPERQVRAALLHMASMVQANPLVKLTIVKYESFAEIIELDGTEQYMKNTINNLRAGGGTNFRSVFIKIKDVLSKYIPVDDSNMPNEIDNVIVAFLTDGQDSSLWGGDINAARKKLSDEFRTMLYDSWEGNLTVHTVGFSGGCDRTLLESMMLAGKTDGMFRYAEPGDGDDTLCQKLQGLFEVASNSSSAKLRIKLNNLTFLNERVEDEVRIPINSNNKGSLSLWVKIGDNQLPSLNINTTLDSDIDIPVDVVESDDPERNKLLVDEWIMKTLDQFASELYQLSQVQSKGNPFYLHCSLIKKRAESVKQFTQSEEIIERLQFIIDQTDDLLNNNVQGNNISRLSDMRFASNFTTVSKKSGVKQEKKNQIAVVNSQVVNQVVVAPKQQYEKYIHYSRNNDGKNRNEIQQLIVQHHSNVINDEICHVLESLTLDDVLYTDNDGNNTVHLAAYCGQNFILEKLLEKFGKDVNINLTNRDGENALTLSIKGYGFWKSIKILYNYDATIPGHRKDMLIEYAVNHGYKITAKILSGAECSVEFVTHDMDDEYIEFLYETSQEKNLPINEQSYLEVTLAKGMEKVVKTLLKKHNAKPNINMLLDSCIPPKQDHPEVDKYLTLLKLVLNADPSLLNQTNDDQESPLFKACEKGNLPHVTYLIQRGAEIDRPNCLGNTPLWISCAKRYPCIIDELIKHKADVNYENKKGNPPLYGLCQKQYTPLKIVERLLAARAKIYSINKKTKDTLILICCRNNKFDILKLFLDYVDEDFVRYKADIDGFDAMMASVEANNPECIKVLHEYGIDLESPTDDNNPILPRATPLHLAAYYNCHQAASTLLELGANPDSKDINGQTPIHLAVIQGNFELALHLKNRGSNIHIKDNYGSTPTMYCRNQKDVERIFVPPYSRYLMKLASGHFTKEDEKMCLEILSMYGYQLGFLSSDDVVNVQDQFGNTPLIKAVLSSSAQVVTCLLELGANPNIRNSMMINSFFWAKWKNNVRIVKALESIPDLNHDVTSRQLECVNIAYDQSHHNSFVLYLSNEKGSELELESSLKSRMSQLERVIGKEYIGVDKDEQNVTPYFDGPSLLAVLEKKDPIFRTLFTNGKVFTISTVASGEKLLTPYEIFSLYLYTSSSLFSSLINEDQTLPAQSFKQTLVYALEKLDSYVGESYLAIDLIDRKLFLPPVLSENTQVTFPFMISGSSLWKVAMETVPQFDGDQKKGTVFILHSKTGKYIGQYSQYMFDAEIIFTPGTKFKVTNWYRGDKICLGQANIREHTFEIKDDEEFQRMINGNKSLIIELEEV